MKPSNFLTYFSLTIRIFSTDNGLSYKLTLLLSVNLTTSDKHNKIRGNLPVQLPPQTLEKRFLFCCGTTDQRGKKNGSIIFCALRSPQGRRQELFLFIVVNQQKHFLRSGLFCQLQFDCDSSSSPGFN